MFTFKIPQPFSLLTVLTLINYFSCIYAKSLNFSKPAAFSSGVATFYAGPGGGQGGSGGACGFEDDGSNAPFYGLTAAGNNNLFKGGAGCGACYMVRCTGNPQCSGKPVTVTITNECPGACNDEAIHFDLSYKAFALLAKPGLAFRLAKGTNKNYIAFAPEFLNGDGDLAAVDLIVSRNNKVLPMKRSFGDTWATGFAPFTNVGPYSVRLTTLWSRKTIVAQNVIPVDWVKYPAGTIFRSRVNF
ncbi:expansin-B4-like [Olea europaea subsp. europaea]|uniref:Expansin-B4-like n=1 Tax=Olea europaea subsp. europaea TaxID=158383 RepID=A0A8S0RK88_OLEEU|nr:expansin-B4-like [Olea europaea subsp. europaea]